MARIFIPSRVRKSLLKSPRGWATSNCQLKRWIVKLIHCQTQSATEMFDKYKISPQERQFYEDNGYLIIKGLIDFASMDLCRKRFIQICKGEVPRSNGMIIVKDRSLEAEGAEGEEMINKISEAQYDEGFMSYTEHPRLLHVVSQLIGEDLRVINTMLINKPPGSTQHPPHQDLFYVPLRPAEKIIASWTAIDEVTMDNGCLFVIPKSHKWKILFPHEHLPDLPKLYHGIQEPAVLKEPRVYLEMSPGDTLFFHSMLVHGSGPNITKKFRKCLTAHYMSEHCHNIDVTSTLQEGIAKEWEMESKRRGYPQSFATQSATDMPDKYMISPEERQFYKDNGYLVIKRLIDFASTERCRRRFIQICKGEVPRSNGMVIVKEKSLEAEGAEGERMINKVSEVQYDDVFMSYTEHPRLLNVVSQFIGEDLRVMNTMLINKPPGCSRHPPHQDLFYFPLRPVDKIIATWTAVDEVTVDNGCLYVIPKSHEWNILYPHEHLPDCPKLYHGIQDPAVLKEPRVYLEMSPGDTLFLHPMLVHGSGPNITKKYRKCLAAHYASEYCRYIDVTNTLQGGLAKELELELKRRGYPVSFADFWRMKSKAVGRTSKQCKL